MSHVFSKSIGLAIALFTSVSGTIFYASPHASAATPFERIALMVTGSNCGEVQQTLIATLRQTDGVFAVDGDSVPGHLLLDVEEWKTSAQHILTVVQTTIGTPLSCQVEVMQSCITAPRRIMTDAPAK